MLSYLSGEIEQHHTGNSTNLPYFEDEVVLECREDTSDTAGTMMKSRLLNGQDTPSTLSKRKTFFF